MSGGCTAPFGDSGACASQVIDQQGFRQSCDSRNVNSILSICTTCFIRVVWNHGLGMPRVWFFLIRKLAVSGRFNGEAFQEA